MRCGRAKSSSAKVLTSARWGRIGRSGDQGHTKLKLFNFNLVIKATVLITTIVSAVMGPRAASDELGVS
jgi:hypothetical protein